MKSELFRNFILFKKDQFVYATKRKKITKKWRFICIIPKKVVILHPIYTEYSCMSFKKLLREVDSAII